MIYLFLLFTVVPAAELGVLIAIGSRIGLWPTLALTIAAGVAGAALAKNQGRRVLAEWQRSLAAGHMPEEGIIGGLLILVAGVLLITPGVLSDFVGFLLLFPPSRRFATTLLRRWLARRLQDGGVRVFTFGQDHGRQDSAVRSSPGDDNVIDMNERKPPPST